MKEEGGIGKVRISWRELKEKGKIREKQGEIKGK